MATPLPPKTIRIHRERLGLDRSTLARVAGISEIWLRVIEGGTRPAASTAGRIREALLRAAKARISNAEAVIEELTTDDALTVWAAGVGSGMSLGEAVGACDLHQRHSLRAQANEGSHHT